MNFLSNPRPVKTINGKHGGEKAAPKPRKTHLRTSAYPVLTLMLAALILLSLAPAASATQTPRQVIGWGYDFHNEVTNIPPDVDFVAIAAGATHSLALRSDGSIAAWGQIYGTPKGHDFIAIACGSNHSLALRSDGSIVSWGWDGHKQVSDTPTGHDFKAVAGGYGHSLALRSNGTIVSWGRDDEGQVSGTPTGNDFVAITAGWAHSLALRSDGTIVAWGKDDEGQVSDTPTGSGFVAVAGGWHHSLALRSDGSIVSWGWDHYGLVADTPTGHDFVAIASGERYSLALRSDGTIVAWGDDSSQQVSGVPAGRKCVAIASGCWHGLGLALDLWSDISDDVWVRTYKITADQAYRVAQGYDDGSFRPALSLVRGQSAKMIVDGFAVDTREPATPTFPDVPKEHTFYRWVEGGYAAGIMGGYDDGSFRPTSQIVRQQFNSMIARILVQRELEFAGVIRGRGGATYLTLAQWYAAEGEEFLMDFADRGQLNAPHLETTAFLIFKGVVQGSEEQGLRYLRPNQNLTRAQGVVMTVRAHETLSG